LLVIDLAEREAVGGAEGLALIEDRDDPLVTVLLDLHDRRGVQERVGNFFAETLDEILEVLA